MSNETAIQQTKKYRVWRESTQVIDEYAVVEASSDAEAVEIATRRAFDLQWAMATIPDLGPYKITAAEEEPAA